MHHLKRYQWISAANAWTVGASRVASPMRRQLFPSHSIAICIPHAPHRCASNTQATQVYIPQLAQSSFSWQKTFTNYNVGWGRLGLSTLVVIKRMYIWLCTLESTGKHSFGNWNNQGCRKNHDHIDQLTGWTSCSGYSCTSPAFSSRSCGSPPTQLTPKCSQEKTVTSATELFTYTAFTEVHVLVIWM